MISPNLYHWYYLHWHLFKEDMTHYHQSHWQEKCHQTYILTAPMPWSIATFRREELLLSSSTSLLKALTLAMILNCSSAFSNYCYLTLQQKTLLPSLDTYLKNIWVLILLWKQLKSLINVSNKTVHGHIIMCYAPPIEDYHIQWKIALTKKWL